MAEPIVADVGRAAPPARVPPGPAAAVVSFDVFETVLVRRVAEPSSVFLLLGRDLQRRGVTDLSPEMFAHARMAAETRARRRATPKQDPTMDAIHTELLDAIGHQVRADADLRSDELELERTLLRANPVERDRVAAERARGRRIAFTSDTYLPGAFVREVLGREGLAHRDDLVLVSCEAGATKRAGELFGALARATGQRTDALVHRGNHRHSDVAQARRQGIGRAEFAASGNPTGDERLLEDHRWATGGLSSVLAGAARAGRLTVPARTRRDEVLRDVAANVAAPTVIAYVLWVLHRARRADLDRVYFLAREGQLLQAVAERLLTRLGWDLEARYLLGSRRSLNLAATGDLDATELAWTLTHAETNTVRQLLGRVGLSPEQHLPALAALGIATDDHDRVPDATRRARLVTAMTTGRLRDPVLVAAGAERREVLRYLDEVGFLDDVRIGMADTSGIGSQFRALDALRRRAGRSPAVGFLAMRDGDRTLEALGAFARSDAIGRTEGWFDDRVRRTGWGSPPGGAALLEMFCTADHGTVTGYASDGQGRTTPRCGPASVAQEAWGAPLVRATVLAVAEHLHLDERHVEVQADLRGAVAAVLGRLWHTPSADEARVWAAFPLAPATSVEPERRVASPYRGRDLLEALRHGAVRDEAWYSWRQASLVLSAPLVRASLGAARGLKRTAARTARKLPTTRR